MEAFLLRATGDLPGGGRFVGIVGGPLLVAAAAAFGLERTRVGRWAARATARGLALFIAVVLLSMVALSAAQIFLRNFFDEGLLWIDPLLRHLVLVLAFAGAILATAGKRHVQINVIGRLLRGRAARIGGAAVAALAGVICTCLARASLELLGGELAFGETVFLNIPSWGIALVFPVTFLVMAFQFFRLIFLELAGRAPVSEEAMPDGEAAA